MRRSGRAKGVERWAVVQARRPAHGVRPSRPSARCIHPSLAHESNMREAGGPGLPAPTQSPLSSVPRKSPSVKGSDDLGSGGGRRSRGTEEEAHEAWLQGHR